jgi:hypothetical protein
VRGKPTARWGQQSVARASCVKLVPLTFYYYVTARVLTERAVGVDLRVERHAPTVAVNWWRRLERLTC